MDDAAKRLLRRLGRRSPAQRLREALEKWGRLPAAELRALRDTAAKTPLMQRLMEQAEEQQWSVKQVAELEMTYVIENPDQGTWRAMQLLQPADTAHTVELATFKENFRTHLRVLIRQVSLKIKKHSDQSVWIRIAWGDDLSPPDHLRPTYVVHHLQTPYVFVNSLSARWRPLLLQALALACGHAAIRDANLRGQRLGALRDLLMRQFEHAFPGLGPCPLAGRSQTPLHPHVAREQSAAELSRLQAACEAFGDGPLPQLQTAVYKLETKFRDHNNQEMAESNGPFRCVITFASRNLLESLRDCAASGLASSPVTPVLSSITQKGRNHFVITDNGPAPSHSSRLLTDTQ